MLPLVIPLVILLAQKQPLIGFIEARRVVIVLLEVDFILLLFLVFAPMLLVQK